MRVAVDATCWANIRGYGRFTRELLPELVALAPDDEFVCLLDERELGAFSLRARNVTPLAVRLDASPVQAAAAHGHRSASDLFRMSRAVRRAAADVFFSPSVYTYFPLPPRLPAVITIHDVIAERFPKLTLPSRRARLFWKLKVALALRQATLVLTVSEFAAADIARVLHLRRDRIRVAPEAPGAAYRCPLAAGEIDQARRLLDLPTGARWFVYVGGFNPHKNLDLLVRAHARAAAALQPSPHLVLVGPGSRDVFHADGASVAAAIEECGTTDLVRQPGFLEDHDLRSVLAGATALVLPSMCEGFGLPAVEAAACGTPVIATKESPLPDLLPGGGVFIEPGDVGALADALVALCKPGAHEALGSAARERALALSWTRCAQATLGALREAVA